MHTRGGGAIRRPSIHIKRGDPVKTISCDIETFSSVDLAKAGVYKYAESPDFEILLFLRMEDIPVQASKTDQNGATEGLCSRMVATKADKKGRLPKIKKRALPESKAHCS